MAFEHFALCDQAGCNARIQIEAPGQLPKAWMALRYLSITMNIQKGTAAEPQVREVVLCGWRCLSKFAKGNILDDAKAALPTKKAKANGS